MTIKAHYLFWLLAALIAGAWPLALPNAHSASPHSVSASVEASRNA